MTKMIFCKEELIGKTVICRSNENDSLLVGEFVGFSEGHNIPIVKDDSGKCWMANGEIVLYSSAIMRMLKSMSPKEQYELLANIRLVNSIIHNERTKKLAKKEKEMMVKPPKRRSCKPLAIQIAVIIFTIAAFAVIACVFSQR